MANHSSIQTDTNPRIPVTLNCSGGISLGSYMAGIFYELTKESLKADGAITIDIITGGSAGAITATLASYYLLGAEPIPDEATESLFYKAWVEKVDIDQLNGVGKAPEKDEETQTLNWSLLSGEVIKQVSSELVGQFKEKIELAIKQNQKTKLGPLALIVTLTNLQGLLKKTDFSCTNETNIKSDEKIKTISSSETRQFLFHSDLLTSPDQVNLLNEIWQKAELSCRASGAFPVAFPPIGDRSNIESINFTDLGDDYFLNPDASLEEKKLDQKKLGGIYEDEKHLQFQYTDGGVLDGLPITKGILLEKLLLNQDDDSSNYFGASDPNLSAFREEWNQLKLDGDRRLYVYIQPTPAKDLQELPRLTKGQFSMLEVGISGLTLPKTEHDAIRLESIRQRNEDAQRKQDLLKKLDFLFTQLNDQQEGKIAEIKKSLRQEIERAIPYRTIKLRRIDPSLVARVYDQERLSQYEAIATALEQNLTPYMKDAINKQEIKRLLASDFLGAFGGFFDRRYREHDFLLGRICGQIWLLENCWNQIEPNNPRIQELVQLIETGNSKFLYDDPKASDLIRSGQIGILEGLIWRFLRILFLESRSGSKGAEDEEKAVLSLVFRIIALKAIGVLLLGVTVVAAIIVSFALQLFPW